jgi:hypothetical protein
VSITDDLRSILARAEEELDQNGIVTIGAVVVTTDGATVLARRCGAIAIAWWRDTPIGRRKVLGEAICAAASDMASDPPA